MSKINYPNIYHNLSNPITSTFITAPSSIPPHLIHAPINPTSTSTESPITQNFIVGSRTNSKKWVNDVVQLSLTINLEQSGRGTWHIPSFSPRLHIIMGKAKGHEPPIGIYHVFIKSVDIVICTCLTSDIMDILRSYLVVIFIFLFPKLP